MRSLLREPSRTLFEAGRVKKMMTFRAKLSSEDAVPSGLMNAGNTCFASSVLQCLVNTHPLQVFLTSSEHLKEKCLLSLGHGHLVKVKHSFCPICNLKETASLMLDPQYSAILPRDLLLNLDKIGDFRLGDQEDAHQFLLGMLWKLHDAFVDIDAIQRKIAEEKKDVKVNRGPSASKSPVSDSNALGFLDAADKQLVEETSFLYQMFGGLFLHKTRCIECGKVSMTPERFLALSLGLASGSSVEEALKNSCKIEVLPKTDESLVCETCERRVTVQRQTTIWQAPEVLIIHLKRFDNDGRKINKSVAFSQNMDFSDVISRDSPHANENPTTYSLYAMIAHYGPFMGAGHYVAFAKLDGKWYLFDDKSVYGINEAIVMKQNAYILFYTKNPSTTASSVSLRSSSGPSSSSASVSPNTSLSKSSDNSVQPTSSSTLAISRLTPPCTAYLAQDGDIMKDITLRVHLPQLESLAMKDLAITLTSSGRFELTSPVYYLLIELVFPLETKQAKCVYYEQDRTLVVFAPIAQELAEEELATSSAINCEVNRTCMSEDDFKFAEEAILPVEPIVGIEEMSMTELAEKQKKAQETIEKLNIESATYKELHENIRELQRNPHRVAQANAQAQQQQNPQTVQAGAKKTSGAAATAASSKRIKPNEPCPCGSGRKYKVCHGKA